MPVGFTASDRQREAIEAELGPVLVLAGPGAGKTFCLIERIRFLIERRKFDPARICAVTFTNKAAEEIAERLRQALGDRALVRRGTLHALCADILREEGEWVGVRAGFGIADEDYQREVLRRLRVWEKRRRPLLGRFGLHRTRGAGLVPDELKLFARYRAFLEHRNLLDFDDLVVRTAELLDQHPEVADRLAGRWDYVLVDEFQDLNPRQYAVVKQLAERHRNLFAVGDDEQSVYSWAGADPRVLRDFANDFGIRRPVMLDENRRTTRQIFETARRLLQHNPPLFEEKVLRAERESEYPIGVLEFRDEAEEARWLLADLVSDQGESGQPWGEYAVLYRTHEMGDNLEAELIGAGIPCRLAAGRALGDDPVVRYLVAAIRVIAAPDDPIRMEAFVKEVLPETLWAGIRSEAEQKRLEPLDWMRTVARRLGRENEDAKKLRRADCEMQNLSGLGSRHESLSSLVEELLSHRVGTYRTVLEDRHEELSDPALDPAVVKLAGRLEAAIEGRRRVRLPRLGGLEIALTGMLGRAGIAVNGGDDDILIEAGDGGASGLALGLFKALQLVHTRPLRDAFRDFVAVDIETSAFDREVCEIVQLGAARVRDGEIVAEYQQLVRPRAPITPESQKVHEITNEEVADQPRLEEVWAAFLEFCGSDILIAHNGNDFDFPILVREAGRCGGAGPGWATYDSLPLARSLHPGSRRLGDLAQAFGIEIPRKHRAPDDARALAQVFPRLQAEKLARARKTALSHLLDYLGLALVLSEPEALPEEARGLLDIAKAFALGRYSDCLEYYRRERARLGADGRRRAGGGP